MWMSDRPRPQQRLASDLASLLSVLPRETFIPFLAAFWTTMAREWTNVDVLRMDKFLLLVRRYVGATFAYLARDAWADTELAEQCMELLSQIPLNPTDGKVSNGLRFHVLDVYVDELDRVDASRSGALRLQMLLEPLSRLEKESPTKAVRARAKEVLADERLKNWEGGAEEVGAGKESHSGGSDGPEEEWSGFDD